MVSYLIAVFGFAARSKPLGFNAIKQLSYLVAVPFLMIPYAVWSLELGDIEVWSSIGQPLEADIHLVSETPDEVAGLRVALADREDFLRYALDDSILDSPIQFRVVQDSSGRNLIRVSSSRSIGQSPLFLLVEAVWTGGRSIRPYTVFLDSQNSASSAGFYGPVGPGETLWAISERHLPTGATMHQMMVAIYEANTEAFGGNMNVLLQGVLLRISESTETSALSPIAATTEVLRQKEEWGGGGQQAHLRLLVPEVNNAQETTSIPIDVTAAGELGQLRSEVETLREQLNETIVALDQMRLLVARKDTQIEGLLARSNNTQILANPDPGMALEPTVISPRVPDTQIVIREPEGFSFFSQILGWAKDPLAWIVLGIAALVGTAVWYLRYRNEDVSSLAGRLDGLEVAVDASADMEDSAGVPTLDEAGSKLDLARAYIDMGDVDGARNILGEILDVGDQQQKEEAQGLLSTLSA